MPSIFSGKIIKVSPRDTVAFILVESTLQGKKTETWVRINDPKIKTGTHIHVQYGYVKKNIFIAENYTTVKNYVKAHLTHNRCFVCGKEVDLTNYKTILLNNSGIQHFQDPNTAECNSEYKSLDDIVECCDVCAEIFGTRDDNGKLLNENLFGPHNIGGKMEMGNATILNNYRIKNKAIIWLTRLEEIQEQTAIEDEYEFKEN